VVVEGFIFELGDRFAEMVIAHAPLEDRQRTRLGRGQPRLQGGGVEGLGGEFEHGESLSGKFKLKNRVTQSVLKRKRAG
jgi:hypothetical protein